MPISHRGPRKPASQPHGQAGRPTTAWLGIAFIAGTGWPTSATAQPATGALTPIVVTATRSPMRADDSVAEVTVIDRAQIEAATGRTVVDLLGRQPGLQVTNSGGPGRTSSVLMRGLESRHTLLLIDGVRHGSVTVGTPAWENLPLEAIERIEIVRGPMSALYGSDAVGGVVQIFTRRGVGPDGVAADTLLAGGSGGFGQAGAGVRFGQGTVDGAVRLGWVQSQGFSATQPAVPFGSFNPDDDGLKQASASVNLGWRLQPGWRAELTGSQAEGRVYLDDGPGVAARAALRTQVVGAQLQGELRTGWSTTARLARSVDEYDTLATASAFTPLGAIRSEQLQLSWEHLVATPWGDALLLAEHLAQTVARPGESFAVSDRTVNAVAAGLNGRSGPHAWQASLRHDRNSQWGQQTTGAAGYRLDLTPQWQVAGSLGTSFVAPSFNQLYFPNFGNPALQPEEGRHGELALRWAAAGHQLRLAYVDNRIRSFISSGPAPTNIPRIRVDGWVASYEGRMADWNLSASAERLDPRNDTAGSNRFGNLLPRRVQNTLRLAADTAVGTWTYGASLLASGPRFDDAANTVRLGGFGTLDLQAEGRVAPPWRIGIALRNVGDKRYETVQGYNQPGREIFVSLRWIGR
jgi:vitamin B12 transporter